MKHLLFYFIAFLSLNMYSQEKYLTRSGRVNFEASVPSFEEVKAINNSATAILNGSNGELAALVLVKGFRFKNALMEEHFNENYAESDQFPKATFIGKIENFHSEQLNTTHQNVVLKGQLTFHGETKPIEVNNLTFSKESNVIVMSGSFKVKAEDFSVKIPKIVRNKVSETIDVSFNFELKQK
ncbi:YceI family protein [Tamlana fucoidanivorans]|uniref:YceI family protein n=1 Tax=Allotamlana fucoidanivorans TaxID=2583814 RepID=A0A5C4SIA7_9FLAO|nr:YceI family protein [Tamlana fucoidanivorans]TNJ43473.1 YceI family protein [Tamlana fucoidanivorans]